MSLPDLEAPRRPWWRPVVASCLLRLSQKRDYVTDVLIDMPGTVLHRHTMSGQHAVAAIAWLWETGGDQAALPRYLPGYRAIHPRPDCQVPLGVPAAAMEVLAPAPPPPRPVPVEAPSAPPSLLPPGVPPAQPVTPQHSGKRRRQPALTYDAKGRLAF